MVRYISGQSEMIKGIEGNIQPAISFNFSKLMKIVRMLGLVAIISFMTVILFTWIYANLSGYVYFSAGEPILSIKYLEWVLGLIGIFAAIDLLQKELDSKTI
ncbi:MAG: hypothetical protein J5U17_03515 [Candidatus Methanoperedens sp.]|nr:hypothetical protein [Candidatus Methanoperedens sp.]MCE8424832.1 hypothetical protein [Candidatus Methanoperedens sp.]MCE8428881.1 hypothetical protein [Candidatus Methanoperedens sp.]